MSEPPRSEPRSDWPLAFAVSMFAISLAACVVGSIWALVHR